MNQPTSQAGFSRTLLVFGLTGLLLLGSGCTTVRCYDIDTVSDEQSRDESTRSQER